MGSIADLLSVLAAFFILEMCQKQCTHTKTTLWLCNSSNSPFAHGFFPLSLSSKSHVSEAWPKVLQHLADKALSSFFEEFECPMEADRNVSVSILCHWCQMILSGYAILKTVFNFLHLHVCVMYMLLQKLSS